MFFIPLIFVILLTSGFAFQPLDAQTTPLVQDPNAPIADYGDAPDTNGSGITAPGDFPTLFIVMVQEP